MITVDHIEALLAAPAVYAKRLAEFKKLIAEHDDKLAKLRAEDIRLEKLYQDGVSTKKVGEDLQADARKKAGELTAREDAVRQSEIAHRKDVDDWQKARAERESHLNHREANIAQRESALKPKEAALVAQAKNIDARDAALKKREKKAMELALALAG